MKSTLFRENRVLLLLRIGSNCDKLYRKKEGVSLRKSLTVQYTLHQMTFWSVGAGVLSFATAFLLQKGFEASDVGVLLAAGNLLSCVFQPILADRADRTGGNVLKWLTVALTVLSGLCFGAIELIPMPRAAFGALYLLGVFAFDAMNPLMNALNVSYTANGYSINYGLSRGLGSLAFSLAALLIGEVMAAFGADWMIWISLGMLVLNALLVLAYPSLSAGAAEEKKRTDCCSIPVFFRRYRWYCASLGGVMLLGMFHAMTENYLIEIVTPLGGDSGSVGMALFIATAVEALVLVYFDRVRSHISDGWLLKVAGLSFLLKAVLFLFARSVMAIYIIQLLQATSYTFLAPTQMYYASRKVSSGDMVKGQAFITAAYTLGCAAGNFTGGQLLSAFGLKALLLAGIAMAAAGTGILFATVERTDSHREKKL